MRAVLYVYMAFDTDAYNIPCNGNNHLRGEFIVL